MRFATKAIHAGFSPDPQTGAIMPPIYMTSTFELKNPDETIAGYTYTRTTNPNFTILEKTLASLEGAEYATVFSSGIGALTALISTLFAGDKVLAIDGLYGGTYRLLTQVFNRFAIEFKTINPKSSDDLEKELNHFKPKWLLVETPTNPLLEIFDIEALAKSTKKYGVTLIVDNTFASPYCQNPLKWGADIVWHSTTKYIGGHSDVLGGVVISNNAILKNKMEFARKTLGCNPSPFDVWLITRGVKTLSCRMEQHQKNAMAVANYLQNHPNVKKVFYPGLTTHPKHEIAKKQMYGFSGMVSAEFDLPVDKIKKLTSTFKLFSLAESLGGIESLVNYPAIMTHASIPPEKRDEMGLKDELIRFSVGIEDKEDLIEDIQKSLKIVI